ncbi:MAG: hypothetical protein HOQ10_12750 [Frateuria sp.]|nr:hypothetical protein [Frateuria sp.]
MDPRTDADAANARTTEAIRQAVNIAQCECVCQLHACVCLLTDTGARAGIQPFLYEQGWMG